MKEKKRNKKKEGTWGKQKYYREQLKISKTL